MTVATIHGFTGSPAMWAPLSLHGAVHLCIAGHGDGVPGTFDAETERLATRLPDTAPVHLVGYSLGARLALAMALRFPARVSRVTLIGVNPGLETETERAERRAQDERWCAILESEGIESFVNAWEALPLWQSQGRLPRNRLAAQRDVRLAHAPAGLAAALRGFGLGSMPNLWPHLAELTQPVHLISGADDHKFTALASRAAAAIPHSRTSSVAGAGHNPILERPQEVAELLRSGDNHD